MPITKKPSVESIELFVSDRVDGALANELYIGRRFASSAASFFSVSMRVSGAKPRKKKIADAATGPDSFLGRSVAKSTRNDASR